MLEDWLKAREALAVYSVDVPSFEEFYEEFREEARLSGRIVVDPIGLFRLEQAFDSRPERLRAYLKDIEFKVKLFWKPMTETATGKPVSGNRTFWEVDWGQVTASVELHNSANGSNTRNHVRSRGKD